MSQPQMNPENSRPVVTQPTASPPPIQRKVSIANDPVSDSHYDNLAFEHASKPQKNSQVCSTLIIPDLITRDAVINCYNRLLEIICIQMLLNVFGFV